MNSASPGHSAHLPTPACQNLAEHTSDDRHDLLEETCSSTLIPTCYRAPAIDCHLPSLSLLCSSLSGITVTSGLDSAPPSPPPELRVQLCHYAQNTPAHIFSSVPLRTHVTEHKERVSRRRKWKQCQELAKRTVRCRQDTINRVSNKGIGRVRLTLGDGVDTELYNLHRHSPAPWQKNKILGTRP